MQALLRGFLLIALLVAVPFAVEQFSGRHPQVHTGGYRTVKDCRAECSPNCAKDCVKAGGTPWWQDWLPSWDNLRAYGLSAAFLLPLLIFLIVLLLFLPRTYQIAEWLTLAEREMNALLRAWGGGYSGESRKNVVKERADWLGMIPVTDDPAPFAEIYKSFFDLNQEDLKSGGPQGAAMGKVRMTAFLLRELYEGNVKNAQLKIFNEFENSPKKPKEPPFIAPGIRQIVGFDRFKPDIKLGDPNYENYEYGFPKDAGVDWFPLWLTVKLNRFPRSIVMIRTDKSRVYNRDVIEELNVQAAPARDEPAVPVGWLRLLESRDSALMFLRWLVYLMLVALTVYVLSLLLR
jgi:hypothetical protein